MLQRCILSVTIIIMLGVGCSHDKYPLPSIPSEEDRYQNLNKAVYNLINPILVIFVVPCIFFTVYRY